MKGTDRRRALPDRMADEQAGSAGHRPRRILHVLDGLSGGGSEEWVRDLVELLPRDEFTFTVCYLVANPGRFDYTEELRTLGARVVYVGLQDQWFAELAPRHPLVRFALRAVRSPYYRWIRPWARHLLILARLWREIRRALPDVVHCHVFHAFVHGVLAARAARVPRVIYTAPALRAQLDERYRWVFPAYRRLGWLVDQFVTGISAEELQEVGIPAERITLFRGAVNFRRVRRVPRETNPVVQEFALAGAFPIILLTGRFSAEKGQAVAVRAARELRTSYPSLRLLLLGEGEEYATIRALVTAEGLEGTVLMPGFRTDMEHFYGVADLYWRTSLIEGMNRACFLAMAYGLPIVAFDTRAPTEILADGENALLVPPGDATALATASRHLLESPAEARALGTAAAERCRRDWDIAEAVETIATLYRHSTPRRRGGPATPRENPLRLCLCVSLFRPAIGGAERQAEQLARAIAARGYRVTVVTQRLPGTAPEEELDGVRVVRAIRTCNRGPLFGLSYVLSLAYYLLRYQGSFDLIQATYLYLDAFAALATRPLHRKPVILRPAGGGPGGDLSLLPTLRFWPLWPRLDRPIHTLLLRTMRRAEAVVALSSQLADELRAAGFPPTRIVRIPNGVDHRRFVPTDGATRRARRAALGAAGPVLTFVGRLHARKDVATLLHAATRLREEWPQIRIMLVGEGPEEEALRRLARELGLQERVSFTGGVADVIPYLDATDVFVHPSLAEGMPGALLEAMACGLPCVATRIGGTADVITDGEDGLLVPPGDVRSLGAAIARLLEDPALARRLGARARATVEARFTMAGVAQQYAALYKALVAGQGPGAVRQKAVPISGERHGN